eukprot:GHVL01010876.1.p1 GENE.GHVL01010876.1~~GHVL01010876.1.p1  ORF type:complete len:104 (+),score=10.09 GHVL01010876.1:50-361(+)
MDKSIQKRCMQSLYVFISSDKHKIFIEPVDPVQMNLIGYHDIVKTPMDFSTIESKLKTYTQPSEFWDDMTLVFDNAEAYNPPKNVFFSPMHTNYFKIYILQNK